MWRKEKGVRCGNSWCPGGESESWREFVGVQNQQLLMRVYINSPSSPLLRLEQYLLKQYRSAPPACQVLLPRQKLGCGFSVINSETEMHDGRREAMCTNTDAGMKVSSSACKQTDAFTVPRARACMWQSHISFKSTTSHIMEWQTALSACSWLLWQQCVTSRLHCSPAQMTPDLDINIIITSLHC